MSIESFNFGSLLTKAGAPTSGVLQQETAVIVGTIVDAGDATVTVTAAGMSNSPVTVAVAVDALDDASAVAGKIRVVLAADPDVSSFFTVGGTGANVLLTALVSAANDATMNIAYDNDTCTGLTPDATSNNTTAGVRGDYHGVASGQIVIDTTNKAIYQNTGDHLDPVWTLL